MPAISLIIAGTLLTTAPAAAQDLSNVGSTITVQAGATLYVGTGGLTNQGGSTLTNQGTLRVDGPLVNPGTLDMSTGALEMRGDLTNTGILALGTNPVTFSGTADQLLTSGGATLYQLLVSKPGTSTLNLAGDLAVSNNLTLTTGLLNTATYQVSLGSAATISETEDSYVTGNVAMTRPVTTTAESFGGLGLILTPAASSAALGSTAVLRTTGTALVGAGTSTSIKRYFRIVPTANSGLNTTLVFTYFNHELNTIPATQLALFQSATGGTPWLPLRNTIAGPNTVTKTGLTDFGIFTLGNAASPLPVTLLDFTARIDGSAAVRLAWATASELNNVGFMIERSSDARAFAVIGTVAGAGTSPTRHDYTLLDAQLPVGVTLLYYRLRQTDLNGDFSYSPVRSVALTPLAAGFVVYPTRVAAGQVAGYLYTGPAVSGTLEILNVIGQVLGALTLDGRSRGVVPLAGLASGTYFIRYSSPAGRFTTRCVVE